MNWLALFKRRELWSIGIYKLGSRSEIFNLDAYQAAHVIGENGLRKSYSYQTTVADPFLFSYRGTLYVFYEIKTDHSHGEIWAKYLSSDDSWVCLGKVLGESFHLSYPQVFEHKGIVYMVPEAARSGDVRIYFATDFPFGWKQLGVLVQEPLLDPTIFHKEGEGFFLFGTTPNYQLKLYHTSDLSESFKYLGITITDDKQFSRGAGSIIHINGILFRLSQDCSDDYGKRIFFQVIDELSISGYAERNTSKKIFDVRPQWMSIGYHHLSIVEHSGNYYVAVDGRRKDLFINTLALAFLRMKETC